MYPSGTPEKSATETKNIERKWTEVEEYEGTVIYRTLLFYNSVFLGRYEKKRILTYSYVFRHSIILVCSIIEFSPIFPTFTSSVL